jgi:hypothetical protein
VADVLVFSCFQKEVSHSAVGQVAVDPTGHGFQLLHGCRLLAQKAEGKVQLWACEVVVWHGAGGELLVAKHCRVAGARH